MCFSLSNFSLMDTKYRTQDNFGVLQLSVQTVTCHYDSFCLNLLFTLQPLLLTTCAVC